LHSAALASSPDAPNRNALRHDAPNRNALRHDAPQYHALTHDAPQYETEAIVPRPVSTLAAFDRLYIRRPKYWLVALLAAYMVAGALFAYHTPNWQAPDEPAHYNYVAHIAKTLTLPVLEMGDYNQQKLENLLSTNFLRRLPPTVLRYEDYQPPLYYLLVTPVYWASGGSLFAIRLFGVVSLSCACFPWQDADSIGRGGI
jgi:hypothetical protein